MKKQIKEENLSHHRVIYEQGRKQAIEEELKFLENNYIALHDEDFIKRIAQIKKEIK